MVLETYKGTLRTSVDPSIGQYRAVRAKCHLGPKCHLGANSIFDLLWVCLLYKFCNLLHDSQLERQLVVQLSVQHVHHHHHHQFIWIKPNTNAKAM